MGSDGALISWKQRRGRRQAEPVLVRDVTLREANGTLGIELTEAQGVEIALLLQEAGIDEIELPRDSSPGMLLTASTLQAWRAAGVSTTTWLGHQFTLPLGPRDELRNTVDHMVATGADRIGLLVPYPVSDGRPGVSGGPSLRETAHQVEDLVGYAVGRGLDVSYGGSYGTITPLPIIKTMLQAAVNAGAWRVHLFDSAGTALPLEFSRLVGSLRRALPTTTKICVHCHDDLGLAAANTLAAAESGADWVDTSVNGVGGRTGNTPFERVAVGLHIYGMNATLRTEVITRLSNAVSVATNRPIDRQQPLLGADVYRLETTGPHARAFDEALAAGHPEMAIPIPPVIVGRAIERVWTAEDLRSRALENRLADVGETRILPERRRRLLLDLGDRPFLTESEVQGSFGVSLQGGDISTTWTRGQINKEAGMPFETRRLGRSDVAVTCLGLGTWAIGGDHALRGSWGPQDDDTSISAIKHAVSSGLSWLDTAPAYGWGHSEKVIGRALKELPPGDRPLIFSKCGTRWYEGDAARRPDHTLDPEGIRAEIELSLARLNVDCIDLYQFHWPDDFGVPIEDSWGAMSRLVDEGKARFIGVCNYTDIALLERCEAVHHVDSLQLPLSLVNRDAGDGLIQWAANNGTAALCYSPMQSGLLTSRISSAWVAGLVTSDWRRSNPEFVEPRLSRNIALVHALAPVAERLGATIEELAIAWVLAWPEVTGAIVGGRSPAQIDGWIGGADTPLGDSDLREIAEAIEMTGAGHGPTRPR